MSNATITAEQRSDIVSREARLKDFCKSTGLTGKNGWTSYKSEQVAHLNPPTNEERSAVEVFDFINDPPVKYFLYVKEGTCKATTWTGDVLGDVSFGREWRDNFGGKRVPITVKAVNGFSYHGTYFKSAGDFARITRSK